jgi:glycosyltransferase involved in cell wall biosynthesis
MPEVSVVLPVFNAAQTIERAVRSILDQSFSDLELIVVDDGSTDDTVDVVSGIHDPRLKVVRCPHRGVAATANTATTEARGPLIARMDADDVSHPQRLEKQIHLLNSQTFDVVGCQVRILDATGQDTETMRRYARWINTETNDTGQIVALRFVELPLVNPTILARRRYFEMGFRDGEFPEDYDLMLRAAANGMRFGKVNQVLFDWSDRPGRLTRTDARYSVDAFARCRRAHLLSGPLHGIVEVDLWGVGQTGKPWLRWLQSHAIKVRHCYDIDHRKVATRMHSVLVSHADTLSDADGTPLIIAVGAAGARDIILPQIKSRGYVAGRDAWFVA